MKMNLSVENSTIQAKNDDANIEERIWSAAIYQLQ